MPHGRPVSVLIRFALVVALLPFALSLAAPFAAAQDATPSAGIVFPTYTPLPDAQPRDGGPIQVVTTTPLLLDFVQQIGGARVEGVSILPANADPHDFEARPDDLVRVAEADLVIEHGLKLDQWAEDLVANSGTEATIVTATDDVPTISSDEEGFEDGDPHVWFDPTKVQLMVGNIVNALSTIDPDGAADYQARGNAYNEQLTQLDAAIQTAVNTIPEERRKLVTNHDAFGYYVARYGLTFVGSVIPSLDTRAEPSAKETAELIEKIKAEGVPAIFTEASLNPALEEELASQAGVKVVSNLYGDSLGEPGSGADTYIGFMETDTRLIVEGLR
jgi:ABC-type Zn uptake system ZnuABC Zn-binding protein ZnuA